jgi:hypothetical protein
MKKAKTRTSRSAKSKSRLAKFNPLEDETASPTQHVLHILTQQGDALTQVREIDFFAYLPTPDARAQYIDKCLTAGFKLRGTSEPYKPGAGYGAIVFHNDAPDEQTMEKIWALLSGFAEDCGGNFDGWETQVI